LEAPSILRGPRLQHILTSLQDNRTLVVVLSVRTYLIVYWALWNHTQNNNVTVTDVNISSCLLWSWVVLSCRQDHRVAVFYQRLTSQLLYWIILVIFVHNLSLTKTESVNCDRHFTSGEGLFSSAADDKPYVNKSEKMAYLRL
jgi:hypothetical protein